MHRRMYVSDEHVVPAIAASFVVLVAVGAVVVQRRHATGDEMDKTNATLPSAPSLSPKPRPLPHILQHWDAMLLALPLVLLILVGIWSAERPQIRKKAHRAEYTCEPKAGLDRLELYADDNFASDIAHSSPDERVRALFLQGLEFAWGFNQYEAAASFQAAADLDAQCGMCLWGVAYAAGPFVNRVSEPRQNELYPVFTCADMAAAHATMEEAMRRMETRAHSEEERALIRAAALRFAVDDSDPQQRHCQADVRAEADAEYGQTLARLAAAQQSAALSAMAAEALMNSIAWNYSEAAPGQALVPRAAMALSLLDAALELDGRHPLALHLKVHLLESQPMLSADKPSQLLQAAGQAADALRAAAFHNGHLVHMPSHVYVRLGRWHDAVQANIAAYAIDRDDGGDCVAPYLPEHNLDVLIFAAGMAGDYHTAIRYALVMRELRRQMPALYIAEGWDVTSAQLIWIQFGRYESLRSDVQRKQQGGAERGQSSVGGSQYAAVVQAFGEVMATAQSVQRHRDGSGARGIPSADGAALRALVSHLEELVDLVPEDRPTKPGLGVGIYAAGYKAIAQTHLLTARARVAQLHGRLEEAAEGLRAGVRLHGSLGYTEPPRLHQSLRPCLAHVLCVAGKHAEALEVAEADLAEWPRNAWGLAAKAQALRGLGDSEQSAQVSAAAAASWNAPLREPVACAMF